RSPRSTGACCPYARNPSACTGIHPGPWRWPAPYAPPSTTSARSCAHSAEAAVMRVVPAGDGAVLVDFSSDPHARHAPVPDARDAPVSDAVLPFLRAAEADVARPAGIAETIPAAWTVLLTFDRAVSG